MNEREENRKVRLNKICAFLETVDRASVREITIAVKLNDSTTRKDIADLIKEYRVLEEGDKGFDGVIYYRVGSPVGLPTVFNTLSNRDQDILAVTQSWLDNKRPDLAGTLAMAETIPLFAMFYELIYDTARTHSITTANVRHRLIERLASNRRIIESNLNMLKELERSPLLTEAGLQFFVDGAELPMEEIESVLKRMNPNKYGEIEVVFTEEIEEVNTDT